METNFWKLCNCCGKKLFYASQRNLYKSLKDNSLCKRCGGKNAALILSRLSESEKIQVKELLKTTISYIEIGKKFGISSATVCHLAVQFGLDRYKAKPKKLKLVDNENAECSKCFGISPLKDFKKTYRKNGYSYLSYCKKCYNEQSQTQLNNSLQRFFRKRCAVLKKRAKKEQVPFTIDHEYLIERYLIQNQKCFYTGQIIEAKVGVHIHRYTLTIDRIIPELGYVKGNIALCLFAVNNAKSNMSLEDLKKWIPEWYQKICDYVGIENDYIY